jgi:chemotaxis protein histidine kinase CheA
MKRSLVFWTVLGAAVCLVSVGARAEGTAGDAAAKKLIKTAMDKNYMAGDFDLAVGKLGQASALCQMKGCSSQVVAEIAGSLAVVHWVGLEDTDTARQDLRAMNKADPKFELSDTYAPPELLQALDEVRAEGKRPAAAPPAASAPAQPAKKAAADAGAAAPAPEAKKSDPDEARRAAAAKAEEDKKAAEEKKAADKKAIEDQREADKRAVEEKREAEKKAAEEKKEAEKKAIEDKKEAERKAAEEKKEAARKAAEDKKAEEIRKAEEAKKAAEEKKEAIRKAAEEKKEAARKAAEDKKAEAQRKAEEAAKKAEEERLAKEEQRLRTPPPVGKLQEQPWREQTMGYPIPVYVKVPTPPKNIEKARTDVAKVVTEYSGPGMSMPQQFELKALPSGGYGGHLPCEASVQEGEVTYFTTALNKYDNPVAGSGSRTKPNKVHINPVFSGKFPHLPNELPPRACTAKQIAREQAEREAAQKAKTGPAPEADAGAPATPSCATNADCADGGVCTKQGCAEPPPLPPVAAPQPRGGCAGCKVGARSRGTFGGAALAVAALALQIARRRGRRSGDQRGRSLG